MALHALTGCGPQSSGRGHNHLLHLQLHALGPHLDRPLFAACLIVRCMRRQGVDPKSVDAVITTCCTFNPTPSLSSFLVNRFGMRPNVKTYSLGGMGCSVSVIALDLANQLLKVRQTQKPQLYCLFWLCRMCGQPLFVPRSM